MWLMADQSVPRTIVQNDRTALYEDTPRSLRTPFLLQSLRTLTLFNGWLIDWLRGYASKSAHFENRSFPETNRPNAANSSPPMGIAIVLCIKRKRRRNLRWFSTKNGKKYKQRLPNQSINPRIIWECADFAAKTGCADFETYPRTCDEHWCDFPQKICRNEWHERLFEQTDAELNSCSRQMRRCLFHKMPLRAECHVKRTSFSKYHLDHDLHFKKWTIHILHKKRLICRRSVWSAGYYSTL